MINLLVALATLLAQPPAHALSPLHPRGFSVNPPPRAGSSEDQSDLRALRTHEATRSAQDCARGARYNHGPGVFTVENLFGDLLSPTQLYASLPLLREAFFASNSLANSFKRHYSRPYPFELPGITSCVGDGKGDGSYPSGHATVGAAVACLAAELFPDRAAALIERGRFHGDIRVVIGRHFPSDVEEGKRLGKQICAHLLRDPEFKSRLESLR